MGELIKAYFVSWNTNHDSGGLVGTEGSMTALIMLLNVGRAKAVSTTILTRICTLWFAVLIGPLFFILRFKGLIGWEDSFEGVKTIKEEGIG